MPLWQNNGDKMKNFNLTMQICCEDDSMTEEKMLELFDKFLDVGTVEEQEQILFSDSVLTNIIVEEVKDEKCK